MIYALPLLLLIILIWTMPARADSIGAWLDGIAACAKTRTPTLVVAGLDPGQTVLSHDQAEEVRLEIEQRLGATGRVRIAAANDVTRLRALQEGTSGFDPDKAEAEIGTAFSGDVAVFLLDPTRNGDVASVRLQAVTRTADCKATSEPVSVAIHSGPGLADIDQVFKGAVGDFAQAAPGSATVDICPFSASSGLSTCSAALTDRLTIALNAEAHGANRMLRGSALTVRQRAPGETCGGTANDVTAEGTFDNTREGSFMSLAFKRGGATLASVARTRIAVEALGCDPTIRPFLDHVAATAHTDADLFYVAAAPAYDHGESIVLNLEAKRPRAVYCWLLAPDETAYVALPVRDGAATGPFQGVRHYPTDFGLPPTIAPDQSFSNLFDCFAVQGGLPPDLQAQWMAAAPSLDAPPKLLEGGGVLGLLDKLRAIPGVTESTARIVVR